MVKKTNIAWSLLFLSVIIFSFCIICYCLQYKVLQQHDLTYAFGRTFLKPEHGRYIATFTNYLLTDLIPKKINIHPNDFQSLFVTPFKAVLIIISFIFIANMAFVFSKKSCNDVLKIPYSNPAYILTYVTVFLGLYNHNFIFKWMEHYFNSFENTVFFEYSMSLVVFAVFISVFAYCFIKKEMPDKKSYIILLFITFLLGLTVEPINLSVLAFLGILNIYFIKEYFYYKDVLTKEQLRTNVLKLLGLYTVFGISLFFYFLPGCDHYIEFDGTYIAYLQNEFVPFFKKYIFGHLIKNSALFYLMTFILAGFLFFKKDNKEDIKRAIILLVSVFLGFAAFFASTFFCGFDFNHKYLLGMPKFCNDYIVCSIICFLLMIGFLTDRTNIDEKTSNKVKIIVCLVILCIFHKNLVTDYFKNMNFAVNKYKNIKTTAYKAEKIAISTSSKDLILPTDSEQYNFFLWFDKEMYKHACYVHYLKNIYPTVQKEKIIYSDEILEEVTFSERELKELNFTNLIKKYKRENPTTEH